MDGDAAALAQLTAQCPDRVEPLVVEGCQVETLRLLKDAWGQEPLHLVVNLMPLAFPHRISEQMRALSMIVRTMGRGLIAGQGAVISLAARPPDSLGLVAQGMCAAVKAGNAALADELSGKGLRFHTLTVPDARPDVARAAILYLGSAAGRHVPNGCLDLD